MFIKLYPSSFTESTLHWKFSNVTDRQASQKRNWNIDSNLAHDLSASHVDCSICTFFSYYSRFEWKFEWWTVCEILFPADDVFFDEWGRRKVNHEPSQFLFASTIWSKKSSFYTFIGTISFPMDFMLLTNVFYWRGFSVLQFLFAHFFDILNHFRDSRHFLKWR